MATNNNISQAPPITMPPSPPRSQAPSPPNSPRPDNFLTMMQGPAIKVIVGHGLTAASYTLPTALLSHHSLLMRREIARLTSPNGATAGIHQNKKRKLEPAASPGMRREPFRELGSDGKTGRVEVPIVEGRKVDNVLHYSDVDPEMFGLFLRFAMCGDYPAAVDVDSFSIALMNYCGDVSQSYSRSNTQPILSQRSQNTAVPTGGNPNLTTTNSALHPPLQHQPPEPLIIAIIPPSIRAWIEGHRLLAAPFMNRAIDHIFHGIGRHFPLTHIVYYYVWSHNERSTGVLRRLLMDFLIAHWHAGPDFDNVLLRTGFEAKWGRLFNRFEDIRSKLLFGRVNTPLVPSNYYVEGILADELGRYHGPADNGGRAMGNGPQTLGSRRNAGAGARATGGIPARQNGHAGVAGSARNMVSVAANVGTVAPPTQSATTSDAATGTSNTTSEAQAPALDPSKDTDSAIKTEPVTITQMHGSETRTARQSNATVAIEANDEEMDLDGAE